MPKHYVYLPIPQAYQPPSRERRSCAFMADQIKHYCWKYGPLRNQQEHSRELAEREKETARSKTDPLFGGGDEAGGEHAGPSHLPEPEPQNKHGEINPKILRQSNVTVNWRVPSTEAAGGGIFNVDFDPGNWAKLAPRRHTKIYKFGSKSGPLKTVDNDDILIIPGHGVRGGAHISYKYYVPDREAPDHYQVTADTLANLLEADELSKKHRVIKLNMCWGGLGLPGGVSFAEGLAKALGQLGYRHVRVGGYLYPITRHSFMSGNHIGGDIATQEGYGEPLKGKRIYYNWQGLMVYH